MSITDRTAALAGFTVLRVGEDGKAERVAERLATMPRERPGPLSSALHVSVDGTAVVHCDWLRPGQPRDDLFQALRGEQGVLSLRSFTGALAADIEGPAAGRAPGVAVLAIRHVRDGDA